MRITLLGVPVDAVTRTEAILRAAAMLSDRSPGFIFTPNPEMLADAWRDERFAAALRSARLNLPDGFGLLLMARFTGQRLPERIAGADFALDLCRLAAEKGKRIFLLGGERGAAEAARQRLSRLIPEASLVGASSDDRLQEGSDGRLSVPAATMARINESRAEILLVAFGHGRQERWIMDNVNAAALPHVRLAMGVGGTFDFLAGRVRRAPLGLRRLGLEWLWRLLMQPRRARRIWKAVVTFPYVVMTTGNGKLRK
jgi:N-acetylglucosaminyldiphosphoundecaprenol N-acetyl-beta-D-mannosaminyltransferase